MPAVPAPPAGATTIVLNWHWACADPPPHARRRRRHRLRVVQHRHLRARRRAPATRAIWRRRSRPRRRPLRELVSRRPIQTALQAAPPAPRCHTAAAQRAADRAAAVIPPAARLPRSCRSRSQRCTRLRSTRAFSSTPPDDVSAEDAAPPRRAGVIRRPDEPPGDTAGATASPVACTPLSRPVSLRQPLSPQRSIAGRTRRRQPQPCRRPAPGARPGAADRSAVQRRRPSCLRRVRRRRTAADRALVVAFASALALAFLYAIYSALRTRVGRASGPRQRGQSASARLSSRLSTNAAATRRSNPQDRSERCARCFSRSCWWR